MLSCSSVGLAVTGIANGKASWFQIEASYLVHVSAPLATTLVVAGITPFVVEPLVSTPRCYHTIYNMAEVCYAA